MKSIMLCGDPGTPERVYAPETLEQLYEIADLDRRFYSKADVLNNPEEFKNVEYVFSTWGMPVFSEEEIRRVFPRLKCVFYAAGSVQAFARPFLNCGIKVFSAWAANGVPVAEYTVSQIILANKGFFASARHMSSGDVRRANEIKEKYPGNYGASVGIIGAGMIGKMVIRMLKGYNLRVKTFDPFLSDEQALELEVEKCGLEELFSTCQTVSNHLANNPQTVGMLDGHLFRSMLPYATFLNTGRGAQVVEDDLVQVLTERPDITAILDVTFPEPPEEGHAFYRLANCILTPHIAGSSGDEVCRMAKYMAEEYKLCAAGKPCRYEVSLKMLETMA